MSFRNRLILFFVAIVVVPMLSVGFVLFSLIEDNEEGKADGRLAARQQLVGNLYDEARRTADALAERVGGDEALATRLRRGDDAGARRRAARLVRRLGLARIRIAVGGRERVDVGRRDAIAPARGDLLEGVERFGVLTVSDRSAPVFARQVRRLTGLHAVIRQDGRTLAATLPGADAARLPELGGVTAGGEDYRVVTSDAVAFDGPPLRVSLLSPRAPVRSDVADDRLLVAGILAGFFVLAISCAILVSRSLQAQIGAFLDAARRLGRGDFGTAVPVQGGDEFAALGVEFNRMAGQLQARMEELQTERARLQNAMRRLGEAFASNLDRAALLEIAVRTAVDGVDADGGRALPSRGGDAARVGGFGALEGQVEEAEAAAVIASEPREVTTEAGTVLSHPLLAAAGDATLGVISVWREGRRPFGDAERDLFAWLAGQAAVSLDNVALHEAVQRQAVTDELTGLYNHRRFQEALANGIERARRLGHGLGLIMLDVDNFKRVNDTYGHQTGDEVLKAVAGVLRDQSREIDEPARYGGEELAVVLPGAGLDGAFQFAERVRRGIEALELSLDDGGTLKVTASFGVAAMPASGEDPSSLVAAADAALYAAKRSGKNRTVRAGSERARPSR